MAIINHGAAFKIVGDRSGSKLDGPQLVTIAGLLWIIVAIVADYDCRNKK
jgi:hypothetical protein